MSISESIKAHREARGMTQQQLAERLYITRQAVSRWETGETTPGIDMTKLIAATLDVPIAGLVQVVRGRRRAREPRGEHGRAHRALRPVHGRVRIVQDR